MNPSVSPSPSHLCQVRLPGRVDYASALTLQNTLAEERGRNQIPDQLILLEHPHTYTLGTSAHDEHLLLSAQELEARQIQVYRVDRGGDITYHGPGQMVGYPIMALPRESEGLRADVIGYVRKLETVIIRLLADDGIKGQPIPGLTGVWVETPDGAAKVCAIGVRVNVKAVTKHGFALNVNTDLDYFSGIIPCGIRDKGVTSLAALLGEPQDMADVQKRLITHFGEIFGREMRSDDADMD